MAPLRVGVASVRAGNGATGFAAGLAWSSARDRGTMLVDADGAGGTVASLLGIDDSRSLANVYSPRGIATTELERQAVALSARPRLRVVPGFRDPGRPGSHTAELLVAAIEGLPEEMVVVDCGTPFAYPDLVDREGAARSLGFALHAVFIVVRAESDLLDNAVRILRTLTIPRARLVLVRPAHRRGVSEAIDLLEAALPGYPLACEWEWNADRCVALRARGEPMQRDAMAEELGLFGAGRIASRADRRRRWPLTRRGVQLR
jgi:MinD-like ATPase involved in chromosome partitioning or flagellar assembly